MTLGTMRDRGERIILYCAANLGTRWCNTGWEPGLDQMIQYFGLDFEISTDRARFLSMFECPNCGALADTLTLSSARDEPGTQGNLSGHNHGAPNPIEMAKIRDEYAHGQAIAEANRAHYAKLHQEASDAARAKKKLQRDLETGRQIIGPPNPWAGRKRGRWI